MFHKFEQKLNDLSQGTVGYFCLRCHVPVATAMCVSRDEPIWNLPEVGREGVTCLVCHRVQYMYGKSNGERRIEPGPIFAPVLGGIGGRRRGRGDRPQGPIQSQDFARREGPGQDIHVTGICFEQLTRSEYLRFVSPGGGVSGHQAGSCVRAISCVAGVQEGDSMPGLPHGPRAGFAAGI